MNLVHSIIGYSVVGLAIASPFILAALWLWLLAKASGPSTYRPSRRRWRSWHFKSYAGSRARYYRWYA